jgi:CheY-like chemotaxis protein
MMAEPLLDLDVTRVFRVLALDDESSILDEVERQLDPFGIDVIKATTAEEAIEILNQRYIDAAIIDLRLYGVEAGREVLRAMRHHAPVAATVIATSYTDDLGEFIGIDAPKLEKIVRKTANIDGDWAVKAISRPFEKWQASAVRIENLDLAMRLLEERGRRLPRLRKGEELACELDRLCRRLFGAASDPTIDSSSITVSLRPIHSEGLSPAVTVEATVSFARDLAERPVTGTPVVLKIASRTSTAIEADRYHRFVKYGVPLMHRVELMGHAEDSALGAVCYSFAGQSPSKPLRSLDEQLAVPERKELVRAVIDNLFNEPAKSWYDVTPRPLAAKHYFSSTYGVDFDSCQDELERSAKAVVKKAGAEVEFSEPSKRADGEFRAGALRLCLPRRTVMGDGVFLSGTSSCLAHGDMHGGNVMLELLGETLKRVCLIDYANAGPAPRLIDFIALEASIRLRDAQALLAGFGVRHERELSQLDYRRATMQLAGRVVDERAVLAATWDRAQSPDAEWALPVLQLSLLANTNFDELEESEYIALAIPAALRHFSFHIGNLTKLRFAAWISAVYERHQARNAR